MSAIIKNKKKAKQTNKENQPLMTSFLCLPSVKTLGGVYIQFVKIQNGTLMLSVQGVFWVFHCPNSSLLPVAGAHFPAFLYLPGHIPFLSTPDLRALTPCLCLWVCSWPTPLLSSVTSMRQEQWTHFLPRGCIRKPPMKSTDIQQFLTEAETHGIGNLNGTGVSTK